MRKVVGVAVGIVALMLLGACGEKPGPGGDPASHAAVTKHLGELADPDPAVRERAAVALGRVWPAGARGVPVLVAALDDEDASVRDAAATSLEALGARALPVLAAFLSNEKDRTRKHLVTTVGQIYRMGATVTPKDLTSLTEASAPVGLIAMSLLLPSRDSATGEGIRDPWPLFFLAYYADPEHLKAMDLDDPDLPEIASASAALFGASALPSSPKRAVPAEVHALLDSEEEVLQGLGAAMLFAWGSEGAGGTPSRIAETPAPEEASDGPERESVETLIDTLAQLTAGGSKSQLLAQVPALLKALQELAPTLEPTQAAEMAEALRGPARALRETWFFDELVGVFGALGENAAAVVPDLTEALAEADAIWRSYFSGGPVDLASVYARNTLRLHQAFDARLALVDALGAIGAPSARARILLERLAAEGDALIRYHAARALRRR